MKRRSLVSILIVLTLVATLMCSMVVTASATSGGSFEIDSTTVSAGGSGYYYVNQEFEYVPVDDEDVVSFFYVEFAAIADFLDEDGDILTGDALFEMEGKVTDSQVTVDEEAGTEVYYLFADVYSDDTVSDAVVVCVDTLAPAFDSDALTTWLTTSEDAVITSEDDDSISYSLNNEWIGAGDEFVMSGAWAELITILVEATAEIDGANELDYLDISLEYCAPSDYNDAEEWSSVDIDSDFDLDETGYWVFRFVVEDMAGNVTTSETFSRLVRAVTPPTITLSTSNLEATSDGITAGVAYTIPTPSATDCLGSTVSIYYTVYKLVDGKYVAIFDSETEEIVEGYEDYIAVGYLTPGADEESQVVDGSYEYLYTIEYRTTDSNGLTASETLEVRVNATTELTGIASLTTWEWVLIAVSVASAIGIVVLLVYKPKKD